MMLYYFCVYLSLAGKEKFTDHIDDSLIKRSIFNIYSALSLIYTF